MDFWRDKESGKLYAYGRICCGEIGWNDGNEETIEGALIHAAEDHKPLWMPWAHFKARFEHVELITSQEAWEKGAHWYFLLGMMASLLGGCLLFALVMFAWEGIATRPAAWPISVALIITSALAFRRSSKLADNYQWHNWKRELKGESE